MLVYPANEEALTKNEVMEIAYEFYSLLLGELNQPLKIYKIPTNPPH
jgi:hypothetical protein